MWPHPDIDQEGTPYLCFDSWDVLMAVMENYQEADGGIRMQCRFRLINENDRSLAQMLISEKGIENRNFLSAFRRHANRKIVTSPLESPELRWDFVGFRYILQFNLTAEHVFQFGHGFFERLRKPHDLRLPL